MKWHYLQSDGSNSSIMAHAKAYPKWHEVKELGCMELHPFAWQYANDRVSSTHPCNPDQKDHAKCSPHLLTLIQFSRLER